MLVLLVALVGVAGCANNTVQADNARVVVDADPEEPLVLLVSTDFIMVFNESGNRVPAFSDVDTLSITGNFDETYSLDDDEPGIYVQLANPSETPEEVRLRVYLDDGLEYDVSVSMSVPGFLSYTYSSDSPGSG